ncbi:hypothetical protein [Streptomyces sp. NPDC003710]
MATRSTVVTAALAAGAALVATGITYANAASEPAQAAAVAAPAPAAAPAAAPVAAPAAGAPAAAAYPDGSNGSNGNNGNNGSGNNNGNNNNYGDNSKGNEGRDHDNDEDENDNDHKKNYEKKIYVNEREYNAHDQGCIVIISGLGANSINVRNDSKRTVEVFNGATCDNGAPIATVGPHSSSNGLVPRRVRGGVKVRNGVVASFRVVRRDDKGY